ncbi:MAG: class I SAM-dependent methyltransferase [Burkholderiales bacterium]|nr:class I SAM-dependent methyltransferase [Burkholderiales bacterium]
MGYAALGEGFNREAYRRLRLPALERLLRRQRMEIRSVLEAGVGTGAYGALWEQLGVNNWVGVDVSSVAVADLQTRFSWGSFHVLDLAKPQSALEGRSFDVVAAIDVLYHIVEDADFERALTWLATKLNKGGALVVSDVFTDSPWGRRFAHVKRRPLLAYERILEPLGLRLLDREPVFAILGDPVPDGRMRAWLLYQIWRLLQKSIRVAPRSLRNPYGAGVVKALWPIDRLISSTGWTRGINLELATWRSPLAC